MKDEYLALKSLMEHPGYAILQELWMIQLAKIDEAIDRAGSRSQESAWRYHAGILKGFKLATTAPQRAIADIEKKDEGATNESQVLAMLEDLKIKTTGEPPQ